MKRTLIKGFFGLLFVLLAKSGFTQDIIILKNGDEIKTKVLEVTSDIVKYKKWDNQDGPVYSSVKTEVFMIKYQNGTKDVFKSQETIVTNSSPASNEEVKKNEAIKTLETYVRNKIKGQVIKLESFRKTNGTMNNVFGQMIYTVNFDIDLRFMANGWLKGNGLEGYWRNNFYVYASEPDLSASGEQYMYATKLYQQGTFLTLGCVAEMNSTDNGFLVKSLSIKTETNFGVQAISNQNNNVQNEKSKADEYRIVKTNHKGLFYNTMQAPGYTDRLKVNSDHKYSSKQKLFFRAKKDEIVKYALFGKMSLNKEEDWIYKTGDTLDLKLDIDGLDLLKVKFNGFKYTGKGEFVLSSQIEDSDGNVYFTDTHDLVINNSDKDVTNAFTIKVPIKIYPEKLILAHPSRDFYLSFLLIGKKDYVPIVEGFVSFKIE